MTGPNSPQRITRAELDRIIQRATELQTGERDVGDNLTPDEVIALGKEVGIPTRYLQQAMLEHQSAGPGGEDDSFLGRAIGPGEVRAQRVVQGSQEDVLHALIRWMEKNELLVLQRQQSGWVSWEPLRGMQAAIRRGAASLDTSKPKFMLSRAELVVATVTSLESGYCHVTLSAELTGVRRDHLIGASVAGTVGVGSSAVLIALNAFLPVAVLPIGAALLISGVVLRKVRPISQRVRLGLERALDFLERGGVKPGHELPERGIGIIDALAGEIRRALGSGTAPRRPPTSESR